MSLNVTFSNVWGILLKEWKGAALYNRRINIGIGCSHRFYYCSGDGASIKIISNKL